MPPGKLTVTVSEAQRLKETEVLGECQPRGPGWQVLPGQLRFEAEALTQPRTTPGRKTRSLRRLDCGTQQIQNKGSRK